MKYCNLHDLYIKWLDERRNQSPLSTIIWFGTYYRGYEIRKIFHSPKKWNWFLSHCPERRDDLLEIQERYYRWRARQTRRSRPIVRAPHIIVNRVGQRLGAQDDGFASDADEDYETDEFVIRDSQVEEEPEDDGVDDGNSDAPWDQDEQVDDAEELRRELADLNDEVLDETTDISEESQDEFLVSPQAHRSSPTKTALARSKARRSRYRTSESSDESNLTNDDDERTDNETEAHRKTQNGKGDPIPLIILEDSDSDESFPDPRDIGTSLQAKKQPRTPIKRKQLIRNSESTICRDENWHSKPSTGLLNHITTPSPSKRRRLVRTVDTERLPNSVSGSDDQHMDHASGGLGGDYRHTRCSGSPVTKKKTVRKEPVPSAQALDDNFAEEEIIVRPESEDEEVRGQRLKCRKYLQQYNWCK